MAAKSNIERTSKYEVQQLGTGFSTFLAVYENGQNIKNIQVTKQRYTRFAAQKDMEFFLKATECWRKKQ